jgi:hypothetical protein
MGAGFRGELIMALAWLAFPLVPVLLEDMYYGIFVGSSEAGPDPVDWGWETWIIMLGPLLGYGFLSGSTTEVADDATGPKTGLRRVVARRAVWVAIGPWAGFLLMLTAALGFLFLVDYLPAPVKDPLGAWMGSPVPTVLSWAAAIIFFGIIAYGWLWPALAALRRAGHIGLLRRALYRGVVTALAFVGSLFASFWAITSAWRGFFFDPRVMPTSPIQPVAHRLDGPLGFFFDPRVIPMVAMALSVVLLSGCAAAPVTYGEMRRRELFHAMLLAWVFGLALIWWWSSRRRRKGPGRRDATSGDRGSS